MIIGPEIRKYEQQIVEQIQALIGIRSVLDVPKPGMPFGEGIAAALQYMLELGESLGFRAVNVEGYAGYLEYGEGEEIVGVLVHLDTVPEGHGWSSPPFAAEIHGGRIVGRGAADNKGPAVVAVYALLAIKELGVACNRRIRIIFGTNEENGMTDMDEFFAREPLPDYAFTPDGAYPIVNAEKGFYVVKLVGDAPVGLASLRSFFAGRAPNVIPDLCSVELGGMDDKAIAIMMEKLSASSVISGQVGEQGTLLLEAVGKTGHGGNPSAGINAIGLMLAFLNESSEVVGEDPQLKFLHQAIGMEVDGQSLGIACQDPIHSGLTLNLAQIALNNRTLEVILNIRYPVTFDGDEIIEKVRQRAKDNGFTLIVEEYLAPLHVPAEHPLIIKLSAAYEKMTGQKTELISSGGGTYARKLQNRGVAFGAGFRGSDNRSHQPDESVGIEDMLRHGEICTQAIYELATM